MDDERHANEDSSYPDDFKRASELKESAEYSPLYNSAVTLVKATFVGLGVLTIKNAVIQRWK